MNRRLKYIGQESQQTNLSALPQVTFTKTEMVNEIASGGLNLTETISTALKNQIEAAVKEQIDPLFNEKPVVEKWFRLLLSGNPIQRLTKRLYSGQPSDLIKVLCSDPKVKESKENNTFLKAISYLLFVEVDGNFAIDVFILMLGAKGNDFHIVPDGSVTSTVDKSFPSSCYFSVDAKLFVVTFLAFMGV